MSDKKLNYFEMTPSCKHKHPDIEGLCIHGSSCGFLEQEGCLKYEPINKTMNREDKQ